MTNVLSQLEPQIVFKYFEEISKIPRGSFNEKQISDYLVKFAKERGLEVIQDDSLNVIIKKPATKGLPNDETIILQGHMDMVCEKYSDVEHDFLKDPLKLRIDGDYIKATGTTLGADNGIGVAYGLAVLDSNDISHPNLEVLFTTNEETGMDGAKGLDPKNLKGKIIISLDAETEGEFMVGCAGGIGARFQIPASFIDCPKEYAGFTIEIKGLVGGHSGTDIHLERGNAICIMGRILNRLQKDIDFYISEINGGSKNNSIPRECRANVFINNKDIDLFNSEVSNWSNVVKKELQTTEPNLVISCNALEKANSKVLDNHSADNVIKVLMLIPNGVQSNSVDIQGLVESSINIGILTTNTDNVEVEVLIRSNVKSRGYAILDKVNIIAQLLKSKVIIDSEYPVQEYNKDSKIRRICEKVYKDMYNSEPKISIVHAGLEGGIFAEKIEGADIISIAPTLHSCHSPSEELSISSTQRVWEYLKNVLKEL